MDVTQRIIYTNLGRAGCKKDSPLLHLLCDAKIGTFHGPEPTHGENCSEEEEHQLVHVPLSQIHASAGGVHGPKALGPDLILQIFFERGVDSPPPQPHFGGVSVGEEVGPRRNVLYT